ncbi:MAG: prepilin-type N-terminal cleavage/methylation domain-containing protein [Planctomycetes bacterium]|nr:prepilin-type N-terminal cleavage/methylation domain-containing protein [Planctomycetota bacterium]
MKLHRFDLSSRRSGFTLLELMVVIVIVGVLLGAFIVSGGGIFGKAEINNTKTRLQTLAQLIASYRSVENDYPDDRLPRNASASALNENSEALCLAFFDPSYTGQKPKLEWLGNTDDDSSSRQLTIFSDKQLKEIVDGWGNPIVYFESMHYDRAAQCFAGEDGQFVEQTVTPARDQGTGLALGQNGFQLISAGPDGIFDTEDDIVHAN